MTWTYDEPDPVAPFDPSPDLTPLLSEEVCGFANTNKSALAFPCNFIESSFY